jgi:hypothetical protein
MYHLRPRVALNFDQMMSAVTPTVYRSASPLKATQSAYFRTSALGH